MKSPIAALAGSIGSTWYLDEAVVERQVVTQRVLPLLRVRPIVRELVHDELVNVTKREHLVRRRLDGHGRESYVRVGRLLVAVRRFTRSRHFFVLFLFVYYLFLFPIADSF